MKVGIAGAGAIGFGMAALLHQSGHEAVLWSPSGAKTKVLAAGELLVAEGAVEGSFQPSVAGGAKALAQSTKVIVIALPANGHKAVFDALAPHLTSDHTVVISSHASLGALYLSKQLAQRDVTAAITAWGTTITTGRQLSLTQVRVNTIRKQIDIATVPAALSVRGLACCQSIFGDRFVDRGSLLAIALSNLNPQNHLGIALCNMSRMEHGESWNQCQNVTPNVGRLMEALDIERLAIAEKLGLKVRTIFEHYNLSFHVPVASVSEMNMAMYERGHPGTGPRTADSRYVTEDVPFGLVPTVALARLAQCPAPLHEAGIQMLSVMYGRDFAAENDLLGALDITNMSLEMLIARCREGYQA